MHRSPAAPFLACAAAVLACGPASAQEKPDDRQIAEAIAPAPAPLRDGASVLGWRSGERVWLREGEGPLVCLADDPTEEGFHVACYHRDLEPYMALGRRLRAEGRTPAEVREARLEAVRSGALALPPGPTALYSLTGPEGSFDPASGAAPEARGLFVLYVPGATGETLGLPEGPTEGPWLMGAGTPFAHVMVSR